MYKIRLSAKSKSIAKIGPIPREDYIVGQKYRIFYEVVNMGKTLFPGGVLRVQISWPNGQIVMQSFTIEPLAPGESYRTRTVDTDALARGFALFYALPIKANDGKGVDLYSTKDQRLQALTLPPKVAMYHIYTIYAKPREEITGYWAMWISAISLAILVITTLIQYLLQLVKFLQG